MPLDIDADRPPVFVAIPKPTAAQMDTLHGLLATLELDLRRSTRKAHRLDYDPEDGVLPAEAFGTVCRLLVDLRYAKVVPEPEPIRRTDEKPALALPHLGTVFVDAPAAKKKAVKRKPKSLAKAPRRFDFASLPPAVECGC